MKVILTVVLSACLVGCATSGVDQVTQRMQPALAAVDRGEMPLSLAYRQFADLSETYLANSPSNRFTNRMVRILADAAESFEQGRITGGEFQSIKARVEIAMAQQDAAFSLAQDQAVRDIWLSRRPPGLGRLRTDCISTLVFNVVRTICN